MCCTWMFIISFIICIVMLSTEYMGLYFIVYQNLGFYILCWHNRTNKSVSVQQKIKLSVF